ncbi:DUF222 domain-containing protein [Microbacterium sp. 22242]|uniref:HNH endonuclease signature motif containing protein n=1 Tax=Microbacterium sp. 22242 TaxID=3453896 RepID=UPI003F83186F
MTTLDAIAALIPTLAGRVSADDGASEVQTVIDALGDEDTVTACREAVEIGQLAEQIQLICAGVIARRSSREAGHSGLAQSRGHRSAMSLLQELGGMTKGEAARQVRVGEALFSQDEHDHGAPCAGEVPAGGGTVGDEPGGGLGGDAEPSDGTPDGDAGPDAGGNGSPSSDQPSSEDQVARDWRQVLRDSLRAGALTSAQFDAIRRGLGDPPSVPADCTRADRAARDQAARDQAAHDEAREAWAHAAAHLVEEAARRTVEELGASARSIRDLLDPEGAEARFQARYERRSFRIWVDQDGVRHASAVCDDESGAYIETIFATALRPRRGGPRFVDADEKTQAADLVSDRRTNDQLAYDLLLDLIRAGALADAKTVFGTRQAGLRLVQPVAPDGTRTSIAFTEDGLTTVPASVAERRVCDAGTLLVTVDACGNPLDVGRESRLFTARQRIGLAIRDGGCRWTGCDRPASYCEAHHIDEWARDDGRTDIDRGILLCRFHHMELHHGGRRITRAGKADFVLHHRGGKQTVLERRLPLKYTWSDIDPPPQRFRPAA